MDFAGSATKALLALGVDGGTAASSLALLREAGVEQVIQVGEFEIAEEVLRSNGFITSVTGQSTV